MLIAQPSLEQLLGHVVAQAAGLDEEVPGPGAAPGRGPSLPRPQAEGGVGQPVAAQLPDGLVDALVHVGGDDAPLLRLQVDQVLEVELGEDGGDDLLQAAVRVAHQPQHLVVEVESGPAAHADPRLVGARQALVRHGEGDGLSGPHPALLALVDHRRRGPDFEIGPPQGAGPGGGGGLHHDRRRTHDRGGLQLEGQVPLPRAGEFNLPARGAGHGQRSLHLDGDLHGAQAVGHGEEGDRHLDAVPGADDPRQGGEHHQLALHLHRLLGAAEAPAPRAPTAMETGGKRRRRASSSRPARLAAMPPPMAKTRKGSPRAAPMTWAKRSKVLTPSRCLRKKAFQGSG